MKSVADLVDRGIALRAELAERETEMKVIETELKARALKGEQVPLVDAEREGRQWLARGREAVVPVVLTSDEIMSSFRDGSAQHQAVAEAARGKLGDFYHAETVWRIFPRDGVTFRWRAAEILGYPWGAEFVSACLRRDKHGIPRSTIRVEWDRADATGEARP